MTRSEAVATETTIIPDSIITCPECGHRQSETMPTDACQFFCDCQGCGTLLRPLSGDCCVFCSFGTVPCPPVQESGKSCC
ncbi:MAG: GDCCVxC domain-containing (seleno)protein [Alphaproteobacteria bacterium]|nr:GDCCVxC domain-containing (seleno)protein [Alphaproteobacteria bacterium]